MSAASMVESMVAKKDVTKTGKKVAQLVAWMAVGLVQMTGSVMVAKWADS